MKKILGFAMFSFVFALISVFNVSAQDSMKKDEMMKKDDHMMMEMKFDKKLPTVAVIAADWCPYCKNVSPVLMGVLAGYEGKVNVVMFDVTDGASKVKALKMANDYGLTKFYNSNKSRTSTVAVLKNNKITYKTSNNTNKSDYVSAIDKALQ